MDHGVLASCELSSSSLLGARAAAAPAKLCTPALPVMGRGCSRIANPRKAGPPPVTFNALHRDRRLRVAAYGGWLLDRARRGIGSAQQDDPLTTTPQLDPAVRWRLKPQDIQQLSSVFPLPSKPAGVASPRFLENILKFWLSGGSEVEESIRQTDAIAGCACADIVGQWSWCGGFAGGCVIVDCTMQACHRQSGRAGPQRSCYQQRLGPFC